MDPTAEDTDFAEPGFIEDDDEDDDLEDVDSNVFPFAGTNTTRPQCSSVISPHQLGSTHDPFSQFPVRWEEAFGPLVQFCKCPSLAHLHLGSRWTYQLKSGPTVT